MILENVKTIDNKFEIYSIYSMHIFEFIQKFKYLIELHKCSNIFVNDYVSKYKANHYETILL